MANKTALGADHPVELLRNVNEVMLDLSRHVTLAYIDAYEAHMGTVAHLQDRWADMLIVDWMAELGHAQARYTRDVARIVASAARDLMR